MKIWFCKVGEVESVEKAGDGPMRQAVQDAYLLLTGRRPDFLFSGWGGELEECERAVVENREPIPSRRPQAEIDREELWQLLDDIDTVSDMVKSDDAAYRRLVEKIQAKRNAIGYSPDGHGLLWRAG